MSMAHLEQNEIMLVRKLRKAGLLEEVKNSLIDLHAGVIMVSCADGDQMSDVFKTQAHWVEHQRRDPRIHLLALNGGAIQLAPDSPTNKSDGEDRVLLKHVLDAVKLKNIQTVVLYAHAPCGIAKAFNLNLLEEIDLLTAAQRFLKEKNPELQITSFLHVDKGEAGKRTYFVSEKKWREYRKK